MTERSNFAPVANLNKARRQIEQGKAKQAAAPPLSVQVDNSRYKSAFGADGAQIVPKKRNQFLGSRASEHRAPLHLPKQQPKFKKNTIQLLEKENDFKPGGRRGPVNKPTRFSPTRRQLEDQKRPKEVGNGEVPEMDKNFSSRPVSKRVSDPLNPGGNNGTSPRDVNMQPEVEEPLDDLDDSGLLVEKQLRQYMPDE